MANDLIMAAVGALWQREMNFPDPQSEWEGMEMSGSDEEAELIGQVETVLQAIMRPTQAMLDADLTGLTRKQAWQALLMLALEGE